jgi:hypothetical protein
MQVYCNGKMVGRLACDPPRDGNVYRMAIAPALSDRFATEDWTRPVDVTIRHLDLEITRRSVVVTDFELRDMPDALHHILKKYSIPADYSATKDMATNRTFYSWRVLLVTPDQLEEIFDLDTYEPDDTYDQPDIEYRMNRLPWEV